MINSTRKLLSIEKRNAEFNALAPMKKRVALGKEVLLNLQSGKLTGHMGNYLLLRKKHDSFSYVIDDNQDLQQLLLNKENTCEGCAIGAGIVARANLGNSVKGSDIPSVRGSNIKVLSEILGNNIPRVLEILFEGWDIRSGSYGITKENAASLRAYRRKIMFYSSNERLRILYQNIVTNRGHFVIPDHEKKGAKHKWS